MKISWDVKSRDLPVPATSIVDGSPDATVVKLNVTAPGSVQFLRVAVPLTADQARRMRPFHRLAYVSTALSVVGAALVITAIVWEITGHGLLAQLLPYVAGLAVANVALVFGTIAVQPKQYPRIPFTFAARRGHSGRIELRDVDPGAAREWRRLAEGAVTITP